MAEEFHKPTLFAGNRFEGYLGGDDPADVSRVAHETANALLSRVRENPDPGVIERLVAYTDENGVDAIAELWANASPRSLPGALWRIYLLRLLVKQDPHGTSLLYQRGVDVATTIDPLIAGGQTPTGPDEITALADTILRGLFVGDFSIALDRAGAFGRVMSAGCASVADDMDAAHPERSTELTARALRFHQLAAELSACARLWRSGSLD